MNKTENRYNKHLVSQVKYFKEKFKITSLVQNSLRHTTSNFGMRWTRLLIRAAVE